VTTEPTEPTETVESVVPETTQSATPKPGEVWVTKAGRYVLTAVMTGPEIENQNLGFVWYDESDGEMSICPISVPLHKKSSLTIAEWGLMMQELTKN